MLKLILITLLIPSVLNASEAVTNKKWANHPEIKKIRELYNAINESKKSGQLNKRTKRCAMSGGSFEIEGALFTDKKGIVRKYAVVAGTGDSIGIAEYYYDEKGVSRFTYRTRSASNGTKKVDRIYFDEIGKLLYTDQKQEGPGWPGSDLDDSVDKPLAAYANLCKE